MFSQRQLQIYRRLGGNSAMLSVTHILMFLLFLLSCLRTSSLSRRSRLLSRLRCLGTVVFLRIESRCSGFRIVSKACIGFAQMLSTLISGTYRLASVQLLLARFKAARDGGNLLFTSLLLIVEFVRRDVHFKQVVSAVKSTDLIAFD